jgi:hypothetical protein
MKRHRLAVFPPGGHPNDVIQFLPLIKAIPLILRRVGRPRPTLSLFLC